MFFSDYNEALAQTNVHLHNRQISESGRISEIKLLKIWRERNQLEFPSIYLEYLLKDKILRDKNKSDTALAANFNYTLKQLARENGNPLYCPVVDPSNSSNIFSDLISLQEKQKIIQQAKRSIDMRYWEHIVY